MKRLPLLFLFAAGFAYPQSANSVPQFTELNFKSRLDLYLKRTYLDPRRHILLLGEVAFDDFASVGIEKWGSGLSGYGKSLAPVYGQRVISNSVEFLAGSIIGDDARYRPSASHGFVKRGLHAAVSTFTAKDRNGHTQIAASRILAITFAMVVANQWPPHPMTGLKLGDALLFNVTDMAQNNLLTEFTPELKRFGNKLWHKAHHAKAPIHP